ncbi:MAG: hypothetical protein ABGW86_03795 [Candidatus Poseidoniia archaeon]
MKIYTEIVYTWDDNKQELVEESSKSFEYQGEVTLCDTKRYWHNHAVADALGIGNGGNNAANNAINQATDKIKAGQRAAIAAAHAAAQAQIDAAASIGDDPVGDLSDNLQDTLGDDPVGDIKDQADKAEDSINETVAVTMDTGQSNLEGILEDNNDSATQAEGTINSNIADANTFVDNTVSLINDVSTGINKHVMDPLLNIGNENALIVNPQGWYDNAFKPQGDAKIWWDYASGNNNDMAEQGAENLGNLFNDYGEILGGVFGGIFNDTVDSLGQAFAQPGVKSRRDASNAGDPFGNPSETRRLISEKRTYNTAQSLINV